MLGMMKTRMGTIRSFEYEAPHSFDALPEVTGKLCFMVVDDEEFVEIKTLGPVDQAYDPDDLQIVRLSKQAVEEIVAHWKSFSSSAQEARSD
jgi:hypothetical protein